MRNIRLALARASMIALLLNGCMMLAQNTPDKPPNSSTTPSTPAPPVDGNGTGAVDVSSDTQGVDFGPYLSRAISSVRENWCRAILKEAGPAPHKKGQVVIEVAILKDGRVSGMRIAYTSRNRNWIMRLGSPLWTLVCFPPCRQSSLASLSRSDFASTMTLVCASNVRGERPWFRAMVRITRGGGLDEGSTTAEDLRRKEDGRQQMAGAAALDCV